MQQSSARARRAALNLKAGALAFAAIFSAGSLPAAQAGDRSGGGALEQRAADYVRFREDVAAIEARPFDSAAMIRDAHMVFAAHRADAISGGWVAYAALVAADSPEFAQALQKEVNGRKRGKLEPRDAFFAKLSQDPTYARKLPGAQAAIDRVMLMTAQDATRFLALGEVFRDHAYSLQRTTWGKAKIPPGQERLAEAEAFAAGRPAAAAPALPASTSRGVTAPRLASAEGPWAHDWGGNGAPGAINETTAQAIIDRVLNLAARYAVGGVNDKMIEVYAKNDRAENCLSLAKLTLRQCIAATRAPFEEAFCVAEHALIDTAECVGRIAGAAGES